MSAATLGMILRPVADSLSFLTSTKVHSTLFPYPWATTLHAARISLVYQANMKKAGQEKVIGWKAYLAGFLIMSWGGMLGTHFLLNLPPPPLYTIHPYINYLGVHLLLTIVFSVFPDLASADVLPTYDLLLFPLDAILRVNSITSSLGLLSPSDARSPHVNHLLASSPLFHLIIGAVASAGGGVSASTLSLWTSHWAFSTPVFLRPAVGWLGTLDLWGGSIVAFVYSLTTAHPAFDVVMPSLSSSPLLVSLSLHQIPPLSPLGAKALSVLILSSLFGYRAISSIPRPRPTKEEAERGLKRKGKAKVQ
ncbi:hypothetical protein Moror_10467 [Moniliophthora roreri MCA 2997]|uniref:Uncharacterized protein n=1 Tax=Moniliophthora roreri (strain MCA 2997) TaxID=1381753 RepID=V2XGF0_MONRO|nr:hypothetical protein Moror_10467 [Moniliophthora roreri MCA 2997]